jgi:hypothetical protein
MIAVLGAFASTLALRDGAGASGLNPVLAVVLVLTSSRLTYESVADRLAGAAEVVVLAPAATGVGWLIVHEAWLGQSLLVVGLSVGIYTRRFGPVVRKTGRLIALPFLALLVAPVPVAIGGSVASVMLWSPVTAVIALGWSVGVAVLAERRRAAAVGEPAAPHPPSRQTRRRLDAPTRMALQMAVGLAAACALGHLFFGDRWAWTLLSAFIVASGNRGRGDVLHRAGLRLVGAGAGTLGATLLAGQIPRGDRLALVALFAVMAVALVLRERSYAFWAAGVTSMLALLHGYYGESGGGLLRERLLGVLLGCAVGVAAAWLVTPVRSRDVLRARVADCLRALSDDLGDDLQSAPRYRGALSRLDEVHPTWRAHGRLPGRRGTRPVDAIAALRRLHELPDSPGQRRQLHAAVGQARRALARPDEPLPADLPSELALVVSATRRAAGNG